MLVLAVWFAGMAAVPAPITQGLVAAVGLEAASAPLGIGPLAGAVAMLRLAPMLPRVT